MPGHTTCNHHLDPSCIQWETNAAGANDPDTAQHLDDHNRLITQLEQNPTALPVTYRYRRPQLHVITRGNDNDCCWHLADTAAHFDGRWHITAHPRTATTPDRPICNSSTYMREMMTVELATRFAKRDDAIYDLETARLATSGIDKTTANLSVWAGMTRCGEAWQRVATPADIASIVQRCAAAEERRTTSRERPGYPSGDTFGCATCATRQPGFRRR